MNTYTVSFFGYRELDDPFRIEARLEKIVSDIIRTKEYAEFLVGRDGEFDILSASVIRRMVKKHGYGSTALVLVLPYMRAEFLNNQQSFQNYYDEIEICTEASMAHYKSAIRIRNRSMVDRSDLVVCGIEHNSGGAYQTVQYARKKKKNIINTAEPEPE